MKLKKYREKIKKTQQECADELSITKEYFSNIEREVDKPSRILADRIIEWSGKKITYSDLWAWDK
jgi:DNA-binding XRE family transcriptional regulator